MGRFIGVAFCPALLLLLALFCVVYVLLPGWTAPRVEVIARFARKYRRKHPDDDEDDLRAALLRKFAPEPWDGRAEGTGVGLGLGGLAGVAFGNWLKELRQRRTRRVVEARVEQALASLGRGP
jgi:hypothetical protein